MIETTRATLIFYAVLILIAGFAVGVITSNPNFYFN